MAEINNPMNYCFVCDKYLGFRGFCSRECHDRYYDFEERKNKLLDNEKHSFSRIETEEMK